jgi:hypothetical protein
VTIPLIDDDVEEAFYETLHVLFYLSRGGGLYEGPLAVATIRLYDFGDGERMASYNLSETAHNKGWRVSIYRDDTAHRVSRSFVYVSNILGMCT